MAKELYDKEIDKNVDWGGDASTDFLPVKGNRVQEFIKNTFNKKAGTFYYDTTNNRYLVFADESTRDEYLEDTQKVELILGTFEAPFNYSAEINLTTPTYVAIISGSVGNYIDFTFDVKNKQGQSVGEDVVCTYTFIRNSTKKVVNKKYRYGTSVHFNIDEYLQAGTNTITIGIVGQTTLAATTIGITYQVIDLKLTDTFNIAQVYNLVETPSTSIEVPYTISGNGVKTMEWYLDGELLEFIKNEDEIVEVSSSRVKYIDISTLPQGKHSIQFRAYTIINEEKFYSETLYRDFMVYRIEDLKEIIAIAITLPIDQDIITEDNVVLKGVTQYVAYPLKFATYNPSATNSNVQILLDDKVVASFISTNGQVNTYNILSTTSGSKTLKIRTDSSEYVIPVEIEESSTTLTEITEGLQLDLQSIGKSNNTFDKDVWEYGDYETTFNGFSWNSISGWVDNRLLISNGASININIAPLADDATTLGKTLEFEFATTNVSDDNAVICDLRNSSGTGLLITASEVTLQSTGGQKVTTKYKSEENIRISLVINKKANAVNKLLAFIYINGVISGAVNFAATDNFISDAMLNIASSEGADIQLKQLRFYNVALTSDQLLNNYILYRDTAEELISLYDRNNIYGEDGYTFSTDILSGQLPIMIVTGNIPALENTSDKNLEITVDVEYTNLQDPSRSFRMEKAIMRPQGTSSMSYPKKNFRLYTKRSDETILYDADGKVVPDKLYSFKEGAQPVKTWCMKADYAESSGTHNTGIARLWNEVMTNARIDNEYVCRTKAQNAAKENNYPYDVRTTVDGFPILMFYRLTSDDDLIFIGKYNFNNDKSTESVFGFKDIPGFDNTRMQCWEVLNNGHHLALFQDVDNFDAEWGEAFEARYPDDGEDADTTDLKAFATWLVSTKDDLEKFKTEKSEHLDLWKIAAYYVYFMRFGAVDQTVKNAMFTSEDGRHFYYINYDNDTINGVRNDGLLIYPPTIDRQSLDETFSTTVYAYAGHDSTLWNNLEADEEFMKMVSDIDNALYAAGLSYSNVIEMFDDKQSDMWCERVYNQDAQYKYIGPYTDSGINNLYMLQGKRQAHRRWWLSRRFNYLDAKFASGEYKSNTFEIKMAGAPIGIDFSITAGFDMNYGYGVNNIPIETGVSLEVGQSHTFTTKQVLNIGDPLRIYSAVNLQEIDVHNFIEYLSTVNMDKVYNDTLGTKLKKLILGVDVSSDVRRNSSITEISGLSSAKRLEYLDISGFQGISYLNLTPFKYFTTLKAKQSGLTSVDFAEGALLQLAELPNTLQALVMNSLNITPANLQIEDTWGSLRYLEIKNCPNFKTNFTYFQDWYKNKTASNNECTLIVEGIEWSNITCAELIELGQLKLDGGTLTLKGRIRLTDSSQEDVNAIREIFGANCFNPNNDLYITAPDAIYVTGPTELYEGDSAQYTAAVFSEYRGEVTFSITSGSNVSINEETGVLTTTEVGSTRTITIRVTHRPTQGVPTNVDYQVKIKQRIYPNVIINGDTIINKQYTQFDATFDPTEYNGSFTLSWSISGDAVTQSLIRISSQTQTRCVIELIGSIIDSTTATLTATMKKNYGGTQTFTKVLSIEEEGVIMTSKSNPKLMKACYDQGWTVSPDKMTKEEAAAVTSIDNFFEFNGETFHEFQYFTGLTTLGHYTFRGICGGLTLPDSLTSLKRSAILISIKELDLKNIEYCEEQAIYLEDELLTDDKMTLIIRKDIKILNSDSWYDRCIYIADSSNKSIHDIDIIIYGTEINKLIEVTSAAKRNIPINVEFKNKNVRIENGFYQNSNTNSFTPKIILINSENISYIGENAFCGCYVSELKLNENLEILDNNISNSKFYFGLRVTIVGEFIPNGSTKYSSIYDNKILVCDNNIIKFGLIQTEYLKIPDNITNILEEASYKSGIISDIKDSIETIDFNNVSEIGSSAFAYYNVKNISAPNLITCGEYCFMSSTVESFSAPKLTILPQNVLNSTLIKTIDLSNVRSIKSQALMGTQIEELTIPSTIEEIHESSLNNTPLKNIISYSEKFVVVENGWFLLNVEDNIIIAATFNKEGIITFKDKYNYTYKFISDLNNPYVKVTGIIYDIEVTSSLYLNGLTQLNFIQFNKNITPPSTDFTTFGYSNDEYVGRDTYNTGENKLVVPENATGYDTGYWLDPLCNPKKCGFTLEKSLPAVETVETLAAKNRELTAQNNMLMSYATLTINNMNLSDNQALQYKELYPTYESLDGKEINENDKFVYNGELYASNINNVVDSSISPEDAIISRGSTEIMKMSLDNNLNVYRKIG